MNQQLNSKLEDLKHRIKQHHSVAVAFSGGVDSTFLAKVAHDVLGDRAQAVIVDSAVYPPGDIREAHRLAEQIGIRLIVIDVDITGVPAFADNPPDRCYHCKKALFTLMLQRAKAEKLDVIFDGTNVDDDTDYRPGHAALHELGVTSPLRDAGLCKEEIRELSRELGLPTWNRPSFACLASRVPYGDPVTPEVLERTWRAEAVLKGHGFSNYRVRNHGDIARIEIPPDAMDRFLHSDLRLDIAGRLKALGYRYVTVDLEGYRTGSLNEALAGDTTNTAS